jgi:hypothetical protein
LKETAASILPQIFPKRWCLYTKMHGFRSQKTAFFKYLLFQTRNIEGNDFPLFHYQVPTAGFLTRRDLLTNRKGRKRMMEVIGHVYFYSGAKIIPVLDHHARRYVGQNVISKAPCILTSVTKLPDGQIAP